MAGRRIGTRGLVALATSIASIGLVGALAYAPQPTRQSVPPPSVALASHSGSVAHASPTPTPTEPSRSPSNATPTPIDPPIPVPTIAFDSPVHDYQVRYPDGWAVAGAEQRSDPDVIASADYRWTGAARRVAAGTSLEEFVAANAQDQCEGAVWDVTEIDGRHALRRAGCGRVDLDVMVGSDVYSFSLAGTGPYESVLLFGRIAATIQLPEPFASTVNDYTLKMPPAWDVERATAPGVPDTFVGPRHLRMTMAMHRASTTTDVVERAATLFPRRSTGSDQYCVGRSSTPPVKDRQFRGSEIDGFPAAVRSSCGFVDATILVRDRIYELSLASPHVASGGDDAAFAMLASRIDVGTAGGGSPVWSQTFRSKLHGYVMHYPKAWRVSPASTARANDVFGTDSSRTRLSITVRPKPRGDQLDLYADGLLPHHAKGDGCHWSSTGIIFIPAGPAPFKAAAIAGRPAVVRSECDFIEAVIDVGDHALVLSMHSGKRLPDADRPTFDMFTAALEVMASAT